MVDQIMIGIIGITVGIILVIYARKFVRWFGTNAWAEEKLGFGGTYTLYRGVGIFVILIAFFLMVGFLDDLLIKILKGLGIIQ